MKATELKPGMMIKRTGLIQEVDLNTEDTFWESAHMTFLDYNDPYWGFCSRAIDLDEEFEIYAEQGTEKYKEIIEKMSKEIKLHIDNACSNS